MTVHRHRPQAGGDALLPFGDQAENAEAASCARRYGDGAGVEPVQRSLRHRQKVVTLDLR